MIRLIFISCLLIAYSNAFSQTQGWKSFPCLSLGMEFRLPPGFTAISIDSLEKLKARGNKAIKEEFGDKQQLGWQAECFQINDTLKRMILINSITRKEVLTRSKDVKAFAQAVFNDNNRLIFERFETRAGLRFDEAKSVAQSEMTIAGKVAHKNKLTCTFNDKLLYTSISYIVESGDKIFLLNFPAIPKASDNDLVESALEKATAIKSN